MQHVDKCRAIAAHCTTTYSERRRQVKYRPCAAPGFIFSFALSLSRLAWPFEKQNAPCLPLLHIAISRTAAWPEWMEVHRANGHTHHSGRSLAPCIKRAIYFFFSLLFLGTAAPTLSCQIKFIGGTTPTTKRRVWKREAELKKSHQK